MNRNVILACTIVAISMVQTSTQQNPNEPSQPLQKGILYLIQGLDFIGETGVDISKKAVLGVTRTVNSGLTHLGKAKSSILDGGVGAFKFGVDFLGNVVGTVPLPGVPQLTNTGRKAINLGADYVNLGGQALIHVKSSLINKTTDAINGVANLAANVASSGLNTGAKLVSLGVNTGFNTIEGAAAGIQSADKVLDEEAGMAEFGADLLALSKDN